MFVTSAMCFVWDTKLDLPTRRPRYDKTTLLYLNIREEKIWGFCVLWNGGDGGLYSSGGENMNEMLFNEGWQRIMNLDLILAFGEIGCIKFRDW